MTDPSRHLPGARAVALLLVAGLLGTMERAWSRPHPRSGDASVAVSPPWPDSRLDINSASEAQLDLLPGVGPQLARRIVEHRQRHGPFDAIERVTDVSGIGPRTLQRMRPHVVVEVMRASHD